MYELLQNAEDADAKWVKFNLFKDRLEVCHNGRLFNREDVRGICGLVAGTKKGDFTKIGQFGIGFKSVYAYTCTPQAYSGYEAFCIKNYVQPHGIDKIKINSDETLFVFPFNHKDIVSEEAFGDISKRLHELGSRTLLFLNNIEEIKWTIHGDESGTYIRENKVLGEHSNRVYILSKVGNRKDEGEEWLIFNQPIELENATASNLKVEVAFKIGKKGKRETLVPADLSYLVVFFPTEKETHLKFLIQGPYRTTPARDNIPQVDKWNTNLIKETGKLIANSIEKIKEMELLNVDFLSILPLSEEDFLKGNMFRPIYDEVLIKLKSDEELLPANDGSYMSSKQAFLARGRDLMDLLDSKQLSLLFGKKEPKWLDSQITQDRTPKLREYLIYKLGIEEVTPEKFAHQFNKEFIEQQSDDLVIKFYSFLLGHTSLWEYSWPPLRNKPFIRLEDNTHVAPFDDGDPQAYLPSGENSSFPTVKRIIAENKQAREFLAKLGLTEPDEMAEIIEFILPKYKGNEIEISQDENVKDVKKFLKVLKMASSDRKIDLIVKIKELPFLFGIKPKTGERYLYKTEDMYLTEVNAGSRYIEVYFDGNPDVIFLDKIYKDLKKEEKELFLELGCSDKVRVKYKESNWTGNVIVHDSHGRHERGLDGFDPDCEIDGLAHALQSMTFEKAKIIWKILEQHYQCIQGIVESSSRQDYICPKTKKQTSKMGKLVRNKNWLPDKKGNFHKPSELFLSDLPDDFDKKSPQAKALAEKLGCKQDIEQEYLSQFPELERKKIEFAKTLTDDEIKLIEEKRKQQEEFPEQPTSNKGRRELKARENYDSSINRTFEKRKRLVRISQDSVDKRTSLREWYQDKEGRVICQICKARSSFQNREGKYYFEAVEMVKDEKEYEANALALCPLCAAKYLYGERTDEEVKQKLIRLYSDFKKGASSQKDLKITIRLCDEIVDVYFVEKHLIDLSPIFIKNQSNE